MNITELTPLEQKAAQAYEAWMDDGDHRFGSIHREAFMAAYITAAEPLVRELSYAINVIKNEYPESQWNEFYRVKEMEAVL